jgi:hypothetical protein
MMTNTQKQLDAFYEGQDFPDCIFGNVQAVGAGLSRLSEGSNAENSWKIILAYITTLWKTVLNQKVALAQLQRAHVRALNRLRRAKEKPAEVMATKEVSDTLDAILEPPIVLQDNQHLFILPVNKIVVTKENHEQYSARFRTQPVIEICNTPNYEDKIRISLEMWIGNTPEEAVKALLADYVHQFFNQDKEKGLDEIFGGEKKDE